jgi:hypothetical protein
MQKPVCPNYFLFSNLLISSVLTAARDEKKDKSKKSKKRKAEQGSMHCLLLLAVFMFHA